MDTFRRNDADFDGILDGQPGDDWAEADVLRDISDDVRETFVTPMDAATQSKHLAAITLALSQAAKGPHAITPAQQQVMDRSRCASGPAPAAGPTRVNKDQAAAKTLASPFAARAYTPGEQVARPTPPSLPSLQPASNVVDFAGTKESRNRPALFGHTLASKVASVAALIAIFGSGLGLAGALPRPAQTAVARVGDVVGLNVPTPAPVEPTVDPVPAKENAIVLPTAPEPPIFEPQGSVPAPVAGVPSTATQTPTAPVVQPAPQVVPSAPMGGDMQSWLNELLRQALIAAQQKSAGQQESGTGTQTNVQQSSSPTYPQSGSQTPAATSTTGSTQQNKTQARPSSRTASN